MEYVAKQGTTALGIIGTALGGLAVAGGSLLAANGGRAANGECSENTPVSRYELGLQQTIAEQGSHIRLLEADKDVIGGDVEEVGDFAKCARVRFSLVAFPASICTAYNVQFCSHFFLG